MQALGARPQPRKSTTSSRATGRRPTSSAAGIGMMLRGWTHDRVVFKSGPFDVPIEVSVATMIAFELTMELASTGHL